MAEIGANLKELNDAEVMVLIISPKIVWYLQKTDGGGGDFSRLLQTTTNYYQTLVVPVKDAVKVIGTD